MFFSRWRGVVCEILSTFANVIIHLSMKRKTIFTMLSLLALAIACGEKPRTEKENNDMNQSVMEIRAYEAKGDSTLYGLACEGGGDSAVVFLPDTGGDPVTYNIIGAMKAHRMFGLPSVGDKVALIPNPENKKEALVVINLEELRGTWVYQVLPTVKAKLETEGMPEMSKEDKVKFDSLVQTLMIPVEYGFTLKRDFTAQSVGGPPRKRALDEESPVEYPRLKRYTEWHVFNGALVFSRSSRSNPKKEMELVNDTAELVMLRGDTLVLRFADHLQGFSRKPDSLATKN